MNNNQQDNESKLLKVLSDSERILYLCGAGFSMDLCQYNLSWTNWIKAGEKYLDTTIKSEIEKLLSTNSSRDLILAAEILLLNLKKNNYYKTFMDSTIGILEPKNQELTHAATLIHRCGDFFATTNYDISIEKAIGAETITYNNSKEILDIIKQNAKNKVIHLHGAYSKNKNLDDIIADSKQYKNILENQGAQFIQNLLSTYPIIVVGCGSTLDDPNLSKFLQFSQKHLELNTPYFYLYCEKDSINYSDKNMIPICYGKDYSDLSNFLQKITMHRLKERLILSKICKINPYEKVQESSKAYSRMHYASKYSKFIGRENDLKHLNEFLNDKSDFLWWGAIGEAGIGKSRLILEWLTKLPSDWFGFFANTSSKTLEDYINFTPFTNTVVVIDNISSNESNCANIIHELQRTFEKSSYKLRIILLERHLELDKKDWFYTLIELLRQLTLKQFDNYLYKNNDDITYFKPLEIGRLKDFEEKLYIKNYLEKYLTDNTEEIIKNKYLKNTDKTVSEIFNSYTLTLKEKYRRPLYLSIYIEVWIYKSGEVAVKNANELLECYIEKEEIKLLKRFHGDNAVLYSYLKLLALACTVDAIFVKDKIDYYFDKEDKFYKFLLSEKVAGKKKTSLTDLFVYTESNSEEPTELKYVLEPLYPDIIKEFIVDYYVDKNEVITFTKLARHISIIEFSTFIINALDDFPVNEKFQKMVIIEPDYDQEYFDYFIALFAKANIVKDIDYVIDILMQTSKKVTKDYGIYEFALWLKFASVLADRVNKNIDIELYFKYSKKFIELLNEKIELDIAKTSAQEIMEAWFIGLYNNDDINKMTEYLTLMDNITAKILNYKDIGQCSATMCSENHKRMFEIHSTNLDWNACLNDFEKIDFYLTKFPKDEDILSAFVFVAKNYIVDLSFDKKFPKIEVLFKRIEKRYNKYKQTEIADILAILHSNLFMNDLQFENKKSQQMHKDKLKMLLDKYPNRELIVASFASVESVDIEAQILKNLSPKIKNDLYENLKYWHNNWNDNIEIAEALARIIFVKINALTNISNKSPEIKKLKQELEYLAKECNHFYAKEDTNEIEKYLDFIKFSSAISKMFKY